MFVHLLQGNLKLKPEPKLCTMLFLFFLRGSFYISPALMALSATRLIAYP